MRIWTRKSASIQPRTSLRKSDVSWLIGPTTAPSVLGHDTALFRRLVLGWINADFRVQIRIFQHFSKSTRKSSSRGQILSKFLLKNAKVCKFFDIFWQILQNFVKFSEIRKNFAKFCRILQKFIDFEKC